MLDKNPTKIQLIIDYLRYEELTSKSSATDENIESLVTEVKKGRWLKSKEELGLEK